MKNTKDLKQIINWNYKPGDRVTNAEIKASVDVVLLADPALADEILNWRNRKVPVTRNKATLLFRQVYLAERCKIPDPTGEKIQIDAYLVTAVLNGNGEPLPAAHRLTFFVRKPPAVPRERWEAVRE